MSLPGHLTTVKRSFRRALVAWYRREARDLPWRDNPGPYSVWLAEIIFQQTRINQGLPYFERFLEKFPDVHELARAKVDEVIKAWEGLGYYARARNLHKAAREIVEERGGEFPATAHEWETLPGVGRYTAGAIASIAFSEQVPVLDGNVKRVLARITNLEQSIDDGAVTARLWEWAAHLVRGKDPGDFNQAMMELGARVCTPRMPSCPTCPVQRYCLAFANGMQERLPIRREKKTVPHHEIVVGAVKKRGRYLLGKRPDNGLLGGLWEFPGGKVRPGEPHELALAREMEEEIGIEVKIGGLLASVTHAYSHFRVTLNVYRCEHIAGAPQSNAHTAVKWVPKAHFDRYAFPKANHKFLHLL